MQYCACVVSGHSQVDSCAAAFQALSEPTRLRIMALLCRARRELCVCEFVDALEEPQYHVSRSLKILEQAGLVTERREGKWVHYGLSSGLDAFRDLALKAIAAIPDKVLANDQRELKAAPQTPGEWEVFVGSPQDASIEPPKPRTVAMNGSIELKQLPSLKLERTE